MQFWLFKCRCVGVGVGVWVCASVCVCVCLFWYALQVLALNSQSLQVSFDDFQCRSFMMCSWISNQGYHEPPTLDKAFWCYPFQRSYASRREAYTTPNPKTINSSLTLHPSLLTRIISNLPKKKQVLAMFKINSVIWWLPNSSKKLFWLNCDCCDSDCTSIPMQRRG